MKFPGTQVLRAALVLLAIAVPAQAFLFRGGGAPSGGGGLTEIGSGYTVVNNGTAASNVPVMIGFGYARGDMPLGNTLVVKDDLGNTLPAQIDELSTRTGMSGATDTPGWLHSVLSFYEPTIGANGTTRTFHVYKTSGSYTPGTGLPVSALTGAHDYKVTYSNVKDANYNVIGSGSFTCDLNDGILGGTPRGGATYSAWAATTAKGNGAQILPTAGNAGNFVYRVANGSGGTTGSTQPGTWNQTLQGTQADGSVTWTNIGTAVMQGGYDRMYDGSIETTLWILARCTDNTTGLPQGQLMAEFYPILWNSSGSLGNVELAARLMLPWKNVAIPAPTGMWGDESIYDGATLLRQFTPVATTFTPADVNTGTNQIAQDNGSTIEAGEALSFSTTGTLPGGLTAGTLYFAFNSGIAAGVGPYTPSLNADPPAGTITLTSQGSGTHTVTRHSYIGQWQGNWLFADDNSHPFYATSIGAQLYPDLSQAQRIYWEETALFPPLNVASPAVPVVIPYSNVGTGPYYHHDAMVSTDFDISGGGTHAGIGPVGDYTANWWLCANQALCTANWDIVRNNGLSETSAMTATTLNQVTGYLPCFNEGPYPSNPGFYSTVLGICDPNDFYLNGNQGGLSIGFSNPECPTQAGGACLGWLDGIFGSSNGLSDHWPALGEWSAYVIGGEPWWLRAGQNDSDFHILAAPTSTLGNPNTPVQRNSPIGAATYPGSIQHYNEVPRQQAWAMRDMTDWATLGADSDPIKQYGWDVLKSNIDVNYAWDTVYWCPVDPNWCTMGMVNPQGVDELFMRDYYLGTQVILYERTHYVSASLVGASPWYNLTFAGKVPVFINSGLDWNACPYWAVAEGFYNWASWSGNGGADATPGSPIAPASINDFYIWQGPAGQGVNGAVNSAGLFTPNSSASYGVNGTLSNGDKVKPGAFYSLATQNVYGSTPLYVCNLNTSTGAYGLATTSGGAGCQLTPAGLPIAAFQAEFYPQPSGQCPSTSTFFGLGDSTSPSGNGALNYYGLAMLNIAGAGTALPHLSAALAGQAARYTPNTVYATYLNAWQPFDVNPAQVVP